MKLHRYCYEVFEADGLKINSLKMDPIELRGINLLVGKNASGKSTVAQTLFGLASMIKGNTLRIGKFHIELESDDASIFKYTCSVTYDKEIQIIEALSKDGMALIDRTNTDAKIFSQLQNKLIEINPPNDKLIGQARRDEKEYPYLEQIIRWAESVHSFKFGHIHSTSFIRSLPDTENTSIKDKDINKILGELKDDTKLKIIEEFNELGYRIELISIRQQGEQNIIFIKENNVKYEIHQVSLSQGMFRSLFLLIFIHHLIEKENSKMIIIDDLCEGLDYDRATKLGKLIFGKMEKEDIQFIATSNDYFLMNVVDVKYWNIIYRKGSEIKVSNYSNSKGKFDQFRLSGLNNFDLFSSDYLDYQS